MSNLVIKTAVTIKADGTELYIEFVEATGTYDVGTNPGGFDTPNPSRNSMAAILVAKHQLIAGDQDADIQVYNVISVASFTINLTKAVNGVLKYDLLLIPVFDDLLTYADDDVVYDMEDPLAPFIKKMVASVWEEITAEDCISDTNVDQKNAYAFPIPDACELDKELLGIKLEKLEDYIDENCSCEDYELVRNQFDWIDGLLKTAVDAFRAEAYNEAQKNIEKIFDYESTVLDAE